MQNFAPTRFNRTLKVTIRNVLEYLNLYSHFPQLKTQFIFVVGCSNSGTTLLTTILGRNTSVLALGDESYIFGQDKIYIKASLKQWDIISRQLHKDFFVEKTPKHIYEIKRIFKFVPDARVLYIIRNPVDTIASQVTRGVDFNYALKKYINSNREGLHFANLDMLYLCSFENLVKDSTSEIKHICSFLGLRFEKEMITDTNSVFHIWGQTDQNNKKKRSKEVSKKITDKTGKGKLILSAKQIHLIREKTLFIKEKVEYISSNYKFKNS